jgi:hypothetical protein
VVVVYPYAVLKTTNVVADSFRTNIIARDDARMTVDANAQDAYILGSLGLKGNTANKVEYTDVIVNGTVERDGYVMAVPSQYTATGVDTYTVLEIQSDVANSLNTADRLVTLGDTEYNGSLLDKVVPISSISLKDTYSFVEVNGYLFIVDGNNVGPVLDEYVVATKTAATPAGADKVWETELLFTDGTTKTVDVDGKQPTVGSLYTYRVVDKEYYELIPVAEGTAAPAEGTNFDVQQAYKTGATLNDAQKFVVTQPGKWVYDVKYTTDSSKANLKITLDQQASNEVTYYTFSYNDNGTPFNLKDDFYSPVKIDNKDEVYAEGALVEVSANTQAGTYYYIVTATWGSTVGSWKSVNAGIANMFVDDTQNYFCNYDNGNPDSDKYYIEDDAVVFMYNNKMDTYQVVKGSDLEGYEEANVQWAFTGGNQKNGNIWVDLAYISVEDNLDETLVYAYVDGNPNRIVSETSDGKYVLTVDVILAGGETVTLTSKEYARENDADLMRLYHALKEEGIYQLIVDDTTLIDVKDYSPAAQYTVTSALYNSMLGLNGTNYFVTSDTIFIPVSGDAESIDAIQTGETVRAVVDTVDHEVLAVIY